MLWLEVTTTTVLNTVLGRLNIALENTLPFIYKGREINVLQGQGVCNLLLSMSAFKSNMKEKQQIRKGREEMPVCVLNH